MRPRRASSPRGDRFREAAKRGEILTVAVFILTVVLLSCASLLSMYSTEGYSLLPNWSARSAIGASGDNGAILGNVRQHISDGDSEEPSNGFVEVDSPGRSASIWNRIPGSALDSSGRVRKFRKRFACISRTGRWSFNSTPRLLPWPNEPSECDASFADLDPKNFAMERADKVVKDIRTVQERMDRVPRMEKWKPKLRSMERDLVIVRKRWRVRDSLKFEWRVPGQEDEEEGDNAGEGGDEGKGRMFGGEEATCGAWNRFDSERFCQVIGGRNVLVVGDHSNMDFADSIWQNVRVGATNPAVRVIRQKPTPYCQRLRKASNKPWQTRCWSATLCSDFGISYTAEQIEESNSQPNEQQEQEEEQQKQRPQKQREREKGNQGVAESLVDDSRPGGKGRGRAERAESASREGEGLRKTVHQGMAGRSTQQGQQQGENEGRGRGRESGSGLDDREEGREGDEEQLKQRGKGTSKKKSKSGRTEKQRQKKAGSGSGGRGEKLRSKAGRGRRLVESDEEGSDAVQGSSQLKPFQLFYIQDDHLDLNASVAANDWVVEKGFRESWIEEIATQNISILVINRAVNSDMSRGVQYGSESYLKQFQQQIGTSLSELRRRYPNLLILFRSSPASHPNCWEHLQPLKEPLKVTGDAAAAAGAAAAADGVAREVVERIGGVFMDVDYMTALRPDGHLGKEDCTRYCQPGPADTWTQVLYNMLVDLL